MPLRNRVDPYGRITCVPNRGTLMGNRGCIHDADKRLREKRWARKAWIYCALEYMGRRRKLMAPGQYTELFFRDEATALSAGHRPCHRCLSSRSRSFKDAWARVWGPARTSEIDEVLHQERLNSESEKKTWQARAEGLPNGTMIEYRESAWCVWQQAIHQWGPGGYLDCRLPPSDSVQVLTPRTIVGIFESGWLPDVALGGEECVS